MSMDWFKWFVGSTTDTKFAAVAKRSKQKLAAVIAVWAMLLERACQADDRGNISGFDCEGAGIVLGLKDGAACAIMDAMRAKGLLDGDYITNWDKRQRKDEKEAARERKRNQREREREDMQRDIPENYPPVTPDCDMSQGVTQSHSMSQNVTDCHAMSQNVTYKTIEDKTILDLKNPPPDNDLDNINNAHARARVAQSVPEGGGFEENELDYPVDENTPSLDFQELRDMYNRSARQEAPFTGYKEYLRVFT